MLDDRCYACGVVDPVTADTYIVCGECGHAFQTREDLVALDRTWWVEMGEPYPGDNHPIYACPCCTHDL